jgi:carbamate kinase
VVEKEGLLYDVEAVVNKDCATSLLASEINADVMVITPDVERVAIHFNKPEETFLDRMIVDQAKSYYDSGEFPQGSMGPKILASVEFTEKTGNDAVIALPEKTADAIEGKAGTRIMKNSTTSHL